MVPHTATDSYYDVLPKSREDSKKKIMGFKRLPRLMTPITHNHEPEDIVAEMLTVKVVFCYV